MSLSYPSDVVCLCHHGHSVDGDPASDRSIRVACGPKGLPRCASLVSAQRCQHLRMHRPGPKVNETAIHVIKDSPPSALAGTGARPQSTISRERATFSLICGSTGQFNIFQIPSMWMTFSKLTAVTIVSAGILKRPSDMIPITTSSASVVPDSWLRGCSDSNLAVTCPDGFHKVTLHCGGALFRGTLQT